MLTDADLQLIYETRGEITALRQRPVTVVYLDGEYDEYTGELIGETRIEREVMAVVTELSSATGAGAERYMANGIKYEKGDIWLSVAIDLIEDIADKIERVEHDGKTHVILAIDKKGLGIRNRYEILGRVAS
ncbi:hypothetical protein [Bacillus sp. FSL K6-3431]|uniref:hypothetical protein n=1 Tax=Bacillus sp. FSL K6-3431 TaxID=2921500 RepID=UPI0030F8D8BE